ncbi:bcl-2-like protein 1 [Archocentrus centrarchus]|uniref:bcl-2-like protein 1 n=1 Tax=Archocentrus centrarchus TaxID=63155 RepID=UPI0011EA3298|nr:bcl-2-like protein 1 [Archocentrus centrarchus]XP_030585461.1 bcl-2-like protein 1 [Archocentrus centrarchus]XP_030585462.1 bcl-2-like protein 1 [Archocentrus centrarchus]
MCQMIQRYDLQERSWYLIRLALRRRSRVEMQYSNRELVEFFISYKLSQKNHPTPLLRPSDAGQRTEEDQANSWPAHHGVEAVKSALIDSGEQFGFLFTQSFQDVASHLSITPDTAQQCFKNVMDELFRDGINWGRVIGLFVFGSAMCADCVENNMSEMVPHIADWMTVYLDEHINLWIQRHGGWDRFTEIFGKGMSARRSRESLKRWLFVGAALVTGLLVGMLMAD